MLSGWTGSPTQYMALQVVYFLDYTANGTAVVYEWIAFPPHICGFGFVFLYTVRMIFDLSFDSSSNYDRDVTMQTHGLS